MKRTKLVRIVAFTLVVLMVLGVVASGIFMYVWG